jgi:hypothetical protein
MIGTFWALVRKLVGTPALHDVPRLGASAAAAGDQQVGRSGRRDLELAGAERRRVGSQTEWQRVADFKKAYTNTYCLHRISMSPSPLVRLRIARRRLVMCWHESEHLQPLCVAAAILIVLFAPMAVIVWHVWFR